MTRFDESTITFPYTRSLGPVTGAFMTALTEKRISPKLVPDHLEDLTPAAEIERSLAAREQFRLNRVYLVRGEGRPSKKQRREIEKFLGEVEDSDPS